MLIKSNYRYPQCETLQAQDAGPLHPGQDLQMKAVCSNHWKISHRVKGVTAAFVHLPLSLAEHMDALQDQLDTL
jgi:hypothetical protein